jgi:hypothetical protein
LGVSRVAKGKENSKEQVGVQIETYSWWKHGLLQS